MPKFKKQEQEQLIENAKKLYIKGFDFESIATIIGNVSATTIMKWATENDFEKSKRSQMIALSEIRNTILESFADVVEGKIPKIKPDEAAKYATAFERFSSKKQVLMYIYEAYEMLTNEFLADIQAAKTKNEKQEVLTNLQTVRAKMDIVITKLNNDVLGVD